VTGDSLSTPFLQSLYYRERHGTSKLAMVMLQYKVLASVLSKKISANVGYSEQEYFKAELPKF